MKSKTICGTAYRAIVCGMTLTALGAAVQAAPSYVQPYAFTTLAGAASIGSADGTGMAARFNGPYAIAADASGNLYVADNWNRTIRKITPAGVVTTLAGTPGAYGALDGPGNVALFGNPWGIAVDTGGNVYVADAWANTIRKITPAGVVSTLAGTPFVSGSADGTGSAALFMGPADVAVDSAGNVYVADSGNSTIRKITPAGVVTTLAGQVGFHGWNPLDGPEPSLDGTGSAARFISLTGLAVDSSGNLFVTDEMTIRKVTPGGVVTTFAGTAGGSNWGTADGTGSAARFDAPYGVTIDPSGNIYVADTWNNTIRKITPSAVVTTIAGLPAGYPPADGSAGATDGPGSAARFNFPMGVAADGTGNVYVADSHNNTVRKISTTGTVSTVAGVSPFQSIGSTDGSASAARFAGPHGAAVDGAGNVYVADTGNHTVRKLSATGSVTTLAGLAGTPGAVDGPGSAARLDFPYGVAADSAGNVYVADTFNHLIRKISPAGLVTTLAGRAGVAGSADGTGGAAQFNGPEGMAVDSAGNVFVADSGNYTVRKVTAAGAVSTLAGIAGSQGMNDGAAATAHFTSPEGVAVDAAGNVYVADSGSFTIRKVTPAGVVSTFAGLAGSPGSVDGAGSTARFQGPQSVVVDGAGNVFVADNLNYSIRGTTPDGSPLANSGNYTIRQITPAGVVSTLAGWEKDSVDGLGSGARFDLPYGLAVDAAGNLYVSCSSRDSNTIRKGQLAGPPVITSQPQNASVSAGTTAQFSVTATGAPLPAYQWYFNGSPFTGATAPTLSLANVRSSDAGNYTVTASNAMGSVTSTPASLTVTAGSTPTGPTSSTGSSGGGVTEPWFVMVVALLAVVRFAHSWTGNRLAKPPPGREE